MHGIGIQVMKVLQLQIFDKFVFIILLGFTVDGISVISVMAHECAVY